MLRCTVSNHISWKSAADGVPQTFSSFFQKSKARKFLLETANAGRPAGAKPGGSRSQPSHRRETTMNRNWRLWIGLAAAACLVPACDNSSSQRPAVSQLKEGVNLLDMKDASWGTNTAFVSAAASCTWTRVGALKPEVYRQTRRTTRRTRWTSASSIRTATPSSPCAAATTARPDVEREIRQTARRTPWSRAARDRTCSSRRRAQRRCRGGPPAFQDHAFHLAHFGAAEGACRWTALLAGRRAELAKAPPAIAPRREHLRQLQLRRLFHVLDRQVLGRRRAAPSGPAPRSTARRTSGAATGTARVAAG